MRTLAFVVGNTLFALAVAALGGTVMFWAASCFSRNRLQGTQRDARYGQLE